MPLQKFNEELNITNNNKMKASACIRKTVTALMVVPALSASIMLSAIMNQNGHIVPDDAPFVETPEVLFPKSDSVILHTDSRKSRVSMKASAIMIGLPALK